MVHWFRNIIILFILLMFTGIIMAQDDAGATDLPREGNIVLVDSAFVRSGPGDEYIPVGALFEGDEVFPLNISEDRQWILIPYSRGNGWVRRSLVRWEDEFQIENLPVLPANITPTPRIPVTNTPFVPTVTPTGNYVNVEGAASAYVRAGPGRGYLRLGQILPGETVEPLARNEDTTWIMIRFSTEELVDGFGWLALELVYWEDLEALEELPVIDIDNLTPTITFTPSATPSITATATDSPTATDIPTSSNTATVTNSPEPTATATATSTATNSPEPTLTETATVTHSPEPLPTLIVFPTETATLTETPTATFTATATLTDIPTETPTETATFTDVPTDTETPIETSSPTDESTATASPTDVPTATGTPSPTDLPTATATETAIPTDTPTETATNSPEPTLTETPTVTDTPENTPTEFVEAAAIVASDTVEPPPTEAETEVPTETPTESVTDIFAIQGTSVAVEATNNASQPPEPDILEETPEEETATRLPIEAIVGAVLLLIVLVYIWFYWQGLAAMGRYADGFVIEECPVCQRGHLQVDERQSRTFGIPTARRTVRCDTCRSVLRQTGSERWRYAVDRIENPTMYDRFNGREVTEADLERLSKAPPDGAKARTSPEFVDNDPQE